MAYIISFSTVTFLFFKLFISHVDLFSFKCPSQATWKIRAQVKCNSILKYFCLYNNAKGVYVEGCTGPDWDRKGSKRIFSGSFTRGRCSENRYQPFYFQTNESMSDCIYAKSICSEKGQIVYKDNSTKKDIACCCDNKKNYSFIKTPRNRYHCIPTEEDCSCYIRLGRVNYTLPTDHVCIQSDVKVNKKIKEKNRHYGLQKKIQVQIGKSRLWLNKIHSKFKFRSTTASCVLFCLCVIGAGGFLLAYLLHKRTWENKQHLNKSHKGWDLITECRKLIGVSHSRFYEYGRKLKIHLSNTPTDVHRVIAGDNSRLQEICESIPVDKEQSESIDKL